MANRKALEELVKGNGANQRNPLTLRLEAKIKADEDAEQKGKQRERERERVRRILKRQEKMWLGVSERTCG